MDEVIWRKTGNWWAYIDVNLDLKRSWPLQVSVRSALSALSMPERISRSSMACSGLGGSSESWGDRSARLDVRGEVSICARLYACPRLGVCAGLGERLSFVIGKSSFTCSQPLTPWSSYPRLSNWNRPSPAHSSFPPTRIHEKNQPATFY